MTIEQMRRRVAKEDVVSRIIKYLPRAKPQQIKDIYLVLFRSDLQLETAFPVSDSPLTPESQS